MRCLHIKSGLFVWGHIPDLDPLCLGILLLNMILFFADLDRSHLDIFDFALLALARCNRRGRLDRLGFSSRSPIGGRVDLVKDIVPSFERFGLRMRGKVDIVSRLDQLLAITISCWPLR